MKKGIFLIIICLIFGLQAKADLAPTVMLHHNGEVKTYMYYQVQNAVNDAIDGDTIYLSDGSFQPFNIDKRIMVRGAGPTTMVDGSCEISIKGSDKLEMPVLDAITFNGDIIVNYAYKQCTIRKCGMGNLIFNDEEGRAFYDVKIDRCMVKTRLNLPNSVKEFNPTFTFLNDFPC